MTVNRGARRLGYALKRADGKFCVESCDKVLSQASIYEMKTLTKVVFDLQNIVNAFNVISHNYDDLKKMNDDLYEKFKVVVDRNTFEHFFMFDAITQVSQRVTNFLASATAFLNISENHLKIRFGKHSRQSTEWNQKRNDLHKNTFAYRFLYELRNFSQHASLPILHISARADTLLEDGPPQFNIITSMKPAKLFDSNYEWKTSIELEIKTLTKDIDLLQLVEDYYKCLRELCKVGIEVRKKELIECGKYLEYIENILRLPVGATPVLIVGDVIETKTTELDARGLTNRTYNFEIIPLGQFKYILSTYIAIKNATNR